MPAGPRCGSFLQSARGPREGPSVNARKDDGIHWVTLCGTTTSSALAGSDGISQRNRSVAVTAPATCPAINPGTSAGRIPAKVSVRARATVTAGFANDVEAVNQYAA